MTSNTSFVFNNGIFVSTPPSFNGESFDIWKERIKIYFDSIDCDLLNFVLNGPFVLIHFINNEAIYKPIYIWTIEEKRNVLLGFQSKYLMTSALINRELFHVYKCSMTKEVWGYLKKIYKVSTEIEKLNICVKENEIPSTSKG